MKPPANTGRIQPASARREPGRMANYQSIVDKYSDKSEDKMIVPNFAQARDNMLSNPPTYTAMDELVNCYIQGPRHDRENVTARPLELLERIVADVEKETFEKVKAYFLEALNFCDHDFDAAVEAMRTATFEHFVSPTESELE